MITRSVRGGLRAISAVVLISCALTACSSSGPTRSAESYCQTFWSAGKQFRAQYQQTSSSDPFSRLVNLLSAPTQLAEFFAKLEPVAPAEIEPDIEVVKNALDKEADNLGSHATNPLAALLPGLLSSIGAQPSWNRINTYTAQHCGSPPQ